MIEEYRPYEKYSSTLLKIERVKSYKMYSVFKPPKLKIEKYVPNELVEWKIYFCYIFSSKPEHFYGSWYGKVRKYYVIHFNLFFNYLSSPKTVEQLPSMTRKYFFIHFPFKYFSQFQALYCRNNILVESIVMTQYSMDLMEMFLLRRKVLFSGMQLLARQIIFMKTMSTSLLIMKKLF